MCVASGKSFASNNLKILNVLFIVFGLVQLRILKILKLILTLEKNNYLMNSYTNKSTTVATPDICCRTHMFGVQNLVLIFFILCLYDSSILCSSNVTGR